MPRCLLLSFLIGFAVIPFTPLHAAAHRPPVPVVHGPGATTAERIAVRELIARLERIYPDERFARSDQLPSVGSAILVGNLVTNSRLLREHLPVGASTEPESFVVAHRIDAGRSLGIIAGADARGVCHGIYALLEKLGCGFFLSHETLPPSRPGPLAFDQWTFADAPLFGDRIVLNWHNFLSSATTWEFSDWERYIDASARMRFNDLMVHAYGNNPMFTFTFNGIAKPIGYFATTRQGRDWGTQHVNDVRRMIGGEVFSDAVFGASIAKGDPARRAADTTALMQRVFAHARDRGLGVSFALDVDTPAANPQEIIRTLPPAARFTSGAYELANPDTPEGFAYYRAQVDRLLALYPNLTRLVVWFRSPDSNTPWRRVQRSELPAAWQQEFNGADEDVSAFALAKVVQAFARALAQTKRKDIELAAGSWAFPFLEAADRYLPPEIPIIALDWWVSFDTARARRDLRKVRSGRKLVPIVWAHHDDRTYIGRPYTPFVDFATKLRRIGASGFGIIHWTTRPLDLHFKSTLVQTWKATEDQPLEQTCDDMAARIFGESARELGGRYLFSWVTEAPMFGRETSAYFVDHPLPTPSIHQKLGRERLALLAAIDAATLTPDGVSQLRFFQRYEEFMLSFFASHTAFERAAEALRHGNIQMARDEIGRAEPEAVIRDYVAAARTGGITPGEQAIVVSLNLRWLPHLLSLRQAVGLEPVRYRLGEVIQEPLAQGAHPNTFHFDEDHRLWKVIDRASAPPVLRLGAISGEKLPSGRYHVTGIGETEVVDGAVLFPAESAPEKIVITPVSDAAQ